MKHKIRDLELAFGKLENRHVRVGLVVLSLALFVLGAGAPTGDGGWGGGTAHGPLEGLGRYAARLFRCRGLRVGPRGDAHGELG